MHWFRNWLVLVFIAVTVERIWRPSLCCFVARHAWSCDRRPNQASSRPLRRLVSPGLCLHVMSRIKVTCLVTAVRPSRRASFAESLCAYPDHLVSFSYNPVHHTPSSLLLTSIGSACHLLTGSSSSQPATCLSSLVVGTPSLVAPNQPSTPVPSTK